MRPFGRARYIRLVGLPTRGDIARTYDAIADSFDKKREAPWPEVIAFVRPLPPSSLVLDLACGNGRHTHVVCNEGHRAIGLDASPRLLAIAERREPRASYVLGDLCNLLLRDMSVSAVIATASIHHLPSEHERLKAVREIARVLRPGGHALLSVWALEQPEFEKSLKEGEAERDVWVPWRGADREVLRFYHLFRDGELRDLVLNSGLHVKRYFRSGDNYFVVAERHG